MAAGATAIRRRSVARKKRSPAPAQTVESRYLNRDETWLEFNRRVLEEADDLSNPLLERVKYLAITASNLDEFLEIRVAGMLQQIEEDVGSLQMFDDTGLTLVQRLERLGQHLHEFTNEQALAWNQRLAPTLAESHIRIVSWRQLSNTDRAFATKFFDEQVDPLLTPVTIDPSHPFPARTQQGALPGAAVEAQAPRAFGHAAVTRRYYDSALTAHAYFAARQQRPA